MINRLNETASFVNIACSDLYQQAIDLNSNLDTFKVMNDCRVQHAQESVETFEREVNRLRRFIH